MCYHCLQEEKGRPLGLCCSYSSTCESQVYKCNGEGCRAFCCHLCPQEPEILLKNEAKDTFYSGQEGNFLCEPCLRTAVAAQAQVAESVKAAQVAATAQVAESSTSRVAASSTASPLVSFKSINMAAHVRLLGNSGSGCCYTNGNGAATVLLEENSGTLHANSSKPGSSSGVGISVADQVAAENGITPTADAYYIRNKNRMDSVIEALVSSNKSNSNIPAASKNGIPPADSVAIVTAASAQTKFQVFSANTHKAMWGTLQDFCGYCLAEGGTPYKNVMMPDKKNVYNQIPNHDTCVL